MSHSPAEYSSEGEFSSSPWHPMHSRDPISSGEESSCEENVNNCPPNSERKTSMKRRYVCPVSYEEDTSDDDSPLVPRPSKIIKQSNGGSSESDSSESAKQAEPITVQQVCRHSCSICDEEYNRHSRCPLCLPCGHTFCSSCLTGVEDSGSRLCPVCRADFGINIVTRLQPCYQLIPGNDVLAPGKRSVDVVTKTQALLEGTTWNVKCLNQLLEVENALNTSSVRPEQIAISLDVGSGVSLPQMKQFLDLLRLTRCTVSVYLLDSFIDPTKMHQERNEQFLKGLLNGRCQVAEFWGYLNQNVFKLLKSMRSLETIGFGLVDVNDVRATINALEMRFMHTVGAMHVSISKRMNLKTITSKIDVPPDMRCVVHFGDVNDEDVKAITKVVDALFTANSPLELQLHCDRFSLRGADTLLGIMRDLEITKAVVESSNLNPKEKKIMDCRCDKFHYVMTFTE